MNNVKLNSAIAKNYEKSMHLTETSSGFMLESESACTEYNFKVCPVQTNTSCKKNPEKITV